MRLYIELDTLTLISQPGFTSPVTQIYVRRGDTLPLAVQFVRDGVVVDPGAVSLYFAVKTSGKYDMDPALVSIGPFVASGSGSSTQFDLSAAFNTAAINTLLLAVDANANNDVASVDAMGEFSWIAGADSTSTRKFIVTIENDLYRSGETLPAVSPSQAPVVFMPGVVGLTGGGVTKLDGLVTLGLAVPRLLFLNIANVTSGWTLMSGTDAENGTTIIRPDDYAGTTNEKVFKKTSISA